MHRYSRHRAPLSFSDLWDSVRKQTLVKDVITGVFILVKDSIKVGDVVEAGGDTGVVELISIRTISLRDLEARVHVVPFSEVTSILNCTKHSATQIGEVLGVEGHRFDTEAGEHRARISRVACQQHIHLILGDGKPLLRTEKSRGHSHRCCGNRQCKLAPARRGSDTADYLAPFYRLRAAQDQCIRAISCVTECLYQYAGHVVYMDWR